MLTKRLIACLDVRDGQLAKSINFVDTKNIGDPVAKAREYYEGGVDELMFYDITASSDAREIMIDVVEAVAAQVFIPFSVGGGIRSEADATKLRLAGAEKINVNSAAVQRPKLISEIAHAIGRLERDVSRTGSSISPGESRRSLCPTNPTKRHFLGQKVARAFPHGSCTPRRRPRRH